MHTYSAKNVLTVVNGIPIVGFHDKDMIEIEENSATAELVKGAQGESNRFLTNDDSGKIKIILSQTSPANKVFENYNKVDKLTGLGTFTIMITDINPNGGTHLGTDAWVEKTAPVKLGQGLNGREWTIICGSLVTT